MAAKFNDWPSGPRKPLAKGLFKGEDKRNAKMQPAVRKALDEAYSGQPRKNGAPHTKG
jgi:hypothetical protein